MQINRSHRYCLGLVILISHGTCLAQDTANQHRPLDQLIEFRNTLKPGTKESHTKKYQVLQWPEQSKASLRKHLEYVNRRAPALLSRGAGSNKIRIYYANLPGYAKGGEQIIVLDKKSFPTRGMDWTRRIIIHELCHTADYFNQASNSLLFRKVVEPKLKLAANLLKQEGLTPRQAAALPLGERRKKIESLIRTKTGLPSAYASANLTECLAEMVSFWVDELYHYKPPAELVPLMEKLTRKHQPAHASLKHYKSGENWFAKGQYKLALKGHAHERMGNVNLAAHDMKSAVNHISRYQHGYHFYYSEWQRLKKKAGE